MPGIGFTVAYFQGWKKTRKHIFSTPRGFDWLWSARSSLNPLPDTLHLFLLLCCIYSWYNLRATPRTLTLGYGWILSTISQSWKEMWRSDRQHHVLDAKVLYTYLYTKQCTVYTFMHIQILMIIIFTVICGDFI